MKNALATLIQSHRGSLRTTLAVLALFAAIFPAPELNAQIAAPFRPPTKEEPAKAWIGRIADGGLFYSMKFDGGPMVRLKQVWTNAFTNDNFLIVASAENVDLPRFEIRDVLLPELARSIAFLSQGVLTVEVVDQSSLIHHSHQVAGNEDEAAEIIKKIIEAKNGGNIWRITASSTEAPTVKMRAVAAPHLFPGTGNITRLVKAAETLEQERLKLVQISSGVPRRDPSRNPLTRIIPLDDQKVVVLIGVEDGIAGIESFIQASEQAFAQSMRRMPGEK